MGFFQFGWSYLVCLFFVVSGGFFCFGCLVFFFTIMPKTFSLKRSSNTTLWSKKVKSGGSHCFKTCYHILQEKSENIILSKSIHDSHEQRQLISFLAHHKRRWVQLHLFSTAIIQLKGTSTVPLSYPSIPRHNQVCVAHALDIFGGFTN